MVKNQITLILAFPFDDKTFFFFSNILERSYINTKCIHIHYYMTFIYLYITVYIIYTCELFTNLLVIRFKKTAENLLCFLITLNVYNSTI